MTIPANSTGAWVAMMPPTAVPNTKNRAARAMVLEDATLGVADDVIGDQGNDDKAGDDKQNEHQPITTLPNISPTVFTDSSIGGDLFGAIGTAFGRHDKPPD